MGWREEVVSLRRPSAVVTVAVSAGLAAAWIGLRVLVFDGIFFPLTYLLPLMVSVWTRSVRALWLMAASFAVAQTVKQFILLPADHVAPLQNWIFYGTTLLNIVAGAGAVQLVMALRNRLEGANQRLRQALEQVEVQAEELATQNEELTQQSEELTQQAEELTQQAEELSQQGEELTAQNEELQVHGGEIERLSDELRSRQALLQALLDSARMARGEETALQDVARAATGMFRDAAAVAIYERRAERLELRAASGEFQPAGGPPGLVHLVLEENRTASLDDVTLRPDLLDGGRSGVVKSALCAPIRSGDAATGAICIFSTATQAWTTEQFALAEWLAGQSRQILEILRMNEALRRQEEALIEASRTKDEFLATLSHELRTPLNAIIGWAQMLLRGALDEGATRRALEIIARNGEVQNRLIEDVLDVSRIVSGKLRLDAEPTDIVPVVDGAVESMLVGANAKGVELVRDFRAGSAMVLGDAARLQQVFSNLLSNAVKFTPSGGRITVTLEREDAGVTVKVGDTGTGIRPEFLPHVFERFAQHDSSTSRRHSGLGLGLAIVRHLTELHGGTVKAESEGLGRGSTFTVCLPARQPAGARSLPASVGAGDVDHQLRGLRVLVVDDEVEARELFRTVLARAGAEVMVATSAAEAFDCLARVPAHVLVSDIGMPGTDGYALIADVRSTGLTLPAIAVTAYGRPEEASRALDAGFQLHLAKPVRPDHLVGAVAKLALSQRPATGNYLG